MMEKLIRVQSHTHIEDAVGNADLPDTIKYARAT